MIAANDPQEYIPGGRQQALRHPDPPELDSASVRFEIGDDFLLHRLEKFKIAENACSEWWTLRKSVDKPATTAKSVTKLSERKNARESIKSFLSTTKTHSDILNEDSFGSKLFEVNKERMSDGNSSRLFVPSNPMKRFSNELDRSEIKGSATKVNPAGTATTVAKTKIRFRSPADSMEEELYVKGNLVIWSRGLSYNDEERARNIICCYSSYFPLKHALWCSFLNNSPESTNEGGKQVSEEEIGESMDCLCIADSQNLRVYTKDDEDFITTLPFPVKKMWATRFGIFIERDGDESHKETKATMFSLSHPLDTASPLAYARNNSTKIIESESLQIVYTSEKLDICMIYDSDMRQHSICRIRPIKVYELDALNKTMFNPSMTNTRNLTPLSMMDSYRSMNHLVSPFNSRPGSFHSINQLPSRGQSPLYGSASVLSPRSKTPILSPQTKKSHSPWIQRLSRLHSAILSVDVSSMDRFPNFDSTQFQAISQEPVHCLDYIWSESLPDGNINSAAINVFITEDLMGQWFLCYLVASRSQLSIVKFDSSNNSNDIVFGMATSISAKDAIAVPHLHMLAILEHTCNVVLYSGLTMIGKLHIGGVLAQHVPSPYAVLKTTNKFFNSPFPRRSSLLPTSTPADPRFDEHLLSPVLPTIHTMRNPTILQIPEIGDTSRIILTNLKDCIDNRLTLQYSDGSFYRVTLPNMVYSCLIEDCLNALRIALPRDLVMTTLSRWYSTRNLPGTIDISHNEEWQMFIRLLLELLGYETSSSACSKGMEQSTPSSAQVKRQKQNADGSEADWKYLLKDADELLSFTNEFLNIPFQTTPIVHSEEDTLHVNTAAVLFSHIRIIHYVLHLVYEDLKLNSLRKYDLALLAKFLSQIASDLNLEAYVMHYWKDFPRETDVYDAHKEQISHNDLKCITKWQDIPEAPTNILQYLHGLCLNNNNNSCIKGYPVINNINTRSKNVVHLFATYLKNDKDVKPEQFLNVIAPPGSRNKVVDMKTPLRKAPIDLTNETSAQKVVLLMVDMKINSRELETYPLAVNFILYDALWICRNKPPTDWPPEAYNLLHRPDLASQAEIISNAQDTESDKFDIFGEVLPKVNQSRDGAMIDGMEETDPDLLKLRFSCDQRVLEARRLLQSSKPVPVAIVQRPDVSDHDFLEEQEKHLYAICTRTMALPVGRGMFTLHTSTPVITAPLPIPPLCLTGKAHPRGTTIELTHIDTPSNMNHWPQFHNGVANGLRINPSAKHVDSTWIIFNKPKANTETLMEHAGFLMALGLNGHLKNLAILNRFDYLVKFHEMTSVGILLGLGAAFRGTSNTAVTKMFSVHVEGLLPPTSIELDVPQNLQVASLLGVGLIYQGTAHRRMIEVMLTEIGRPPGPEMENSVDRQSYSLAAGLALGLVILKQGGKAVGLADLNVPDTLHYYMVGGSKRILAGSQKEKYKVPSFQIREGSCVNLDVTAPGATLALGLMYLGTGNTAIAGWMAPPDTQYLLDFVRPDFLMLRTLSRALILWDDILPEKDWIEQQVPDTIRPYCMVEPNPHIDLDYEAMNQAYCNIIAGACFALGLKFAGSADESAFEVLLDYCHMFTSLTSKSIAELAGKPTIETCLNVVLISASIVMAGTGNLEIMRIVRYLRRRVGLASSAVVTYGSHLAMHMALGLLFLGGGRYTLSNSPTSVAALICAFYPKFPTHSNDNRYHLQAFRHLYVLAAEPRLVIPTDIITGRMCYANLNIVKLDGTTITIKGPALIPDLNTLYKVSVQDERYWPVVFERERNWDQLLKVLSSCGYIDVKQRAGCLSYTEDKTGFRSELARTLTQSDVVPWDPPSKSIISFSSDTIVRLFVDHFLNPETSTSPSDLSHNTSASSAELEYDNTLESKESHLQHALTQITYESVIQDKLSVLPLFINLIQIVKNLSTITTPLDIWHLKIIYAFVVRNYQPSNLTSNEMMISLHQKALNVIDNWEPGLRDTLKAYILKHNLCDSSDFEQLAKYVAFYNIPYGLEYNNDELLMLIYKLQEKHACDSEVIDKVLRILRYVR